MTDEALQISRTAGEADHYDARCFWLLYENQDLHGPVKVVVVDDPTLDRLYQVLPHKMPWAHGVQQFSTPCSHVINIRHR